MNITYRRVAMAALALTAVSALTACGGGDAADGADPAADTAHGKLEVPSGPGSFVAVSGDPGRAYVAQVRSDQKAGRSTNPGLTALTDEQLLALGRTTCTAKEQGATDDQIQKAVADGISGVSASDVAPYVQAATTTLCRKS
ncbi:MAG TPA: DUF732 domain-containing protein [Pseudonocardia sp.]|nr:DUF732 domain-containing protein [Pseudonocardia sp.]